MILVDELRHYDRQQTKLRYEWWCHMVSDLNEEELHAFAKRLGLRREWFQGNHYDITAKKREQALRFGASLVTSKQLVERNVLRRS